MELHEIEELFKSVNPKAMKAFLRNAATLQDPNASHEMKVLAVENIKAITQNKPIPRSQTDKPPKQPKKIKPVVAEQATQLVQQPAVQTPATTPSSIGKIQYKYSPAYQHYGVTEDMWNKTPEAHADLFNHHNEVMAGKHPGLMHIKNAVEQTMKPKIAKSIDSLYDLFVELKKRL